MDILEGKRVFIVEDNINNRAIEQLLLEKHGARVGIDRWGTDAIQRLQAFAPVDIIILDLMFPNNVSGYEIFREIRALAMFDTTPIVAVSAADASVAIPMTQEFGFSGFISKPIDFERFAGQIASIIDGTPVWYTPDRF